MGMMSPCGVRVQLGQRWKEVDPRMNRVVTVVGFGEKHVYVAGKGWADVPAVELRVDGAKTTTWAQLKRFNGKHTGYALVGA